MGSSYDIKFSNLAVKQLKKISKIDSIKVLRKIRILEDFSVKSNNLKKLKGTKKLFYRLRIGNISVIFEVENNKNIIWIVAVGYRGDIYKK